MYIPKRYGQSKIDKCAFCEKRGLFKSKQKLIVCENHKESILPDIKCVCGSYLELKEGKFGPFFLCINCGCVNLNKGLEMQTMQKKEKIAVRPETKKEAYMADEGNYPGFDYGIR